MKKKYLSILLSLLLVLSLAACGGGSGGDSGGSTESSRPSGSNNSGADFMPESGYGGWNLDEPMEGEPEAPGVNSTLPANTKIIRTADISLETKEFESAQQAVSSIVEGLGGWFESRSVYQGGSYRSLSCTVRVPAQAFASFLDQAGQIAHVTRRDEYAEDVSEAYYDNESRLATQRTKLDRLQLLLARADVMEDIIALESAISETELEIEHLTGSLRKYDSLVGYATITLHLQEVYRLSTEEEAAVTFGQRMGSAFSLGFRRGVSNLEDFVIGIARNWVNLIILAVIVTVSVLIGRWYRKRRTARRQPPPPPAPPESKE